MDIRNLLELQGAFECNIVVKPAPDEKDVLVEAVLLGKGLDRLYIAQSLADLRRNLLEPFQKSLAALFLQHPLDIRHIQRQHEHEDELRRIRLRRGDGDLRAGPGIKHLCGFTRDGGADDVRHGKALRAETFRLLQCRERVARLARLADDDHQGILINNRRTVAELGRNIDLDGNARKLFNVILADQPRVIRRAAGDDVNLVERCEKLLVPTQFLHDEGFAVLGNARRHRIAHGFRLLVDLLEHEMLVAAFFRCLSIPVDLEDLFRHRLAPTVRDVYTIGLHDSHLAVVYNIRAPRARNDCRDIRGNEILPLAETDDERVVLLRADEAVGMRARHEYERVGALDARKHLAYRSFKVAVVDLFQQMCDDLRIRL